MPITAYETRLLTSVYGVGWAQAQALADLLNAIESDDSLPVITLAARQALRSLSMYPLTSREVRAVTAAIEGFVTGEGSTVTQDAVNVLLRRLRINHAWNELLLPTALVPAGFGQSFGEYFGGAVA